MFPHTANSQQVSTTEFSLYYEVNQSSINPHYLGNDGTMDSLFRYISLSPQIDSVLIYAVSSPDGPYEFNGRLARKRAQSARDYVVSCLDNSQVPVLVRDRVSVNSDYENWEGLVNAVRQSYFESNRETVLQIICSDVPVEEREKMLKALDGGVTYKKLTRELMARLRVSTIVINTNRLPHPSSISMESSTPTIHPIYDSSIIAHEMADSAEVIPAGPLSPHEPRERESLSVAFKTNLLFDVATMLNLSMEVPIYRNRLSLLVEENFPWWVAKNNQYCLQLITVGAEARYWFAPRTAGFERPVTDRLLGHFVGAYAFSGKCDLQWKREINYQAEGWSAGLTYGYSAPLSQHLNIEFSVSAGYAHIPWRDYVPSKNYDLLFKHKEGVRGYIGITQAHVSLVWPINIGRTSANPKKGVRP